MSDETSQAEVQSNNKELYLKISAYSILTVGILVGLFTLSAPAGTWLGFWDFRRGFDILRISNNYGDILAWILAAGTVVTAGAASYFKSKNLVRYSSLAAVGTLVVIIAWLVPESFRPPEGVNYPLIHDISTDTSSPPEFVDVLPLRADAPNPTVYGTSDGMTPEELTRLKEEAYPDLVPQYYDSSPEEVFDRALAAVNALGWELVAQVPEQGRIEATDTTRWFRFKDDIVIRIEPAGGQTLVNARSVSRVGRGDIGANAIRLRAFFELLGS